MARKEKKEKEVTPIYTYPKDFRPKPIAEQLALLQGHLGISSDKDIAIKLAEQELPMYAEGYYAVPRWQALAPTYCEAVEKLFVAISKQRAFINSQKWLIVPDHMQQWERSIDFLNRLELKQPGQDALVIPAQFGMRRRGYSGRAARTLFEANEFGLGVLGVGTMILTHPERIMCKEDLQVCCVGDRNGAKDLLIGTTDGQSYEFLFYWSHEGFKFDVCWLGHANNRYGGATGFLRE